MIKSLYLRNVRFYDYYTGMVTELPINAIHFHSSKFTVGKTDILGYDKLYLHIDGVFRLRLWNNIETIALVEVYE
jgi:hypothetical protein